MAKRQKTVLYKTTCNLNGKVYVGVHKTNNIDDGYIGCGIYTQAYAKAYNNQGLKSHFHSAVLKYGYENFIMEPMVIFNNEKEAYDLERSIVDRKWVNSSWNYNTSLGGIGGCVSKLTTKEENDIFQDFMSGMYKSEIREKYGISNAVIYRITKNRDTSKRKKRSQTRRVREYLLENKEKLIERYKKGDTVDQINEDSPVYIIPHLHIFDGIGRDPKYVRLKKEEEDLLFTTAKEISDLTDTNHHISGILQCCKGEIGYYKGAVFLYYENYKNGARTNGYVKDTSTHYKGIKLYKDGKEFVIENNLSEFCRKHSVEFAALQRLINGKQNTSYGFKMNI